MLPVPDTNTLLLGHGQDDLQGRFNLLRRLTPGPSQHSPGGNATENTAPSPGQEGRLREASQDFEALFLHQLLKQMRATVPHHNPLRGRGEEFWESHFDMEMATVLARSGGIGLGDMILDQLRQSQIQATRDSTSLSNPTPLTILSPSRLTQDVPPTTDQTSAPQSCPETSLAESDRHVASAQESAIAYPANAGSTSARPPDAVHIPGTTSSMSLVRSLARSIEERGGVVPEHPGGLEAANPTRPPTRPPSTVLPQMHWPVEGRISSDFGWRRDPFTGEQAWHSGVDMVAPKGTPIEAAWDGRVAFVGQRGGYGNLVVLEHAGGWRSYYAHNEQNTVQAGDTVQTGQQIATVGSSGRSTGPHLHFEVRQGNMAWNPKQIRDRLEAGLHIGNQDSAQFLNSPG